MAGYDFDTAYGVITSAQPYRMKAVADVWRNFAMACQDAATRHQGTANDVTGQPGDPYQAFGDRASPQASWMKQAGGHADKVAAGLASMGDVGTAAQSAAYRQSALVSQTQDDVSAESDEHFNGAMTQGLANQVQLARQKAAEELNGKIEQWSEANAAFDPGPVPAAPGSGSGSSYPSPDGSGTAAPPASGGSAAPAGAPHPASNASAVGAGEYPHSSVVGPEGGDFAGWVRDPDTGYLVDPATGQEYDPITGRFVDPVTGKPFGDVQQYATRLEGLAPVGAPPGRGVGVPPSGGGFTPPAVGGGLFGGAVPPSLLASNPAAAQLQATAANSMAAKAFAARQLGLSEARQGGRPYLPPTQAGGAGAGRAAGRNSSRSVSEPESTWTSRPGGRRGYLPPARAGKEKEREGVKAERPDWLVEDDSVWSSGTRALDGVLGGVSEVED